MRRASNKADHIQDRTTQHEANKRQKSKKSAAYANALVIVDEFNTGARDVLRVTLENLHGHDVFSIRVWTIAAGRHFIPTRRGITLRIPNLSNLRKALREAYRKAKKLR